jgi:iron(III) transport system ATP-binding protein
MGSYILQVENLSKSFGKVKAVINATFNVNRGEIFSIVGPSGSGKTTLLRCIGGIETPDEGVIVFNDRVIFDSKRGINVPPEARGMSYVPQTWALWPHMKVRDNIAFGLKMRGFPREEIDVRVREISKALKIEELLDRYPWQLSGGQQQRVAVARALALKPQLILFDEPLSNLDAALREEARVWLKNLLKELNITALYVTHDIHEALFLSDRIAFMYDGRIRVIETPENIYMKRDIPELARLFGYNIIKARVIDHERGLVMVNEEEYITCDNPHKVKGDTLVIFAPSEVKVGYSGIKAKVLRRSFMGGYFEYSLRLGDNIIRVISEAYLKEGSDVFISINRCTIAPII